MRKLQGFPHAHRWAWEFCWERPHSPQVAWDLMLGCFGAQKRRPDAPRRTQNAPRRAQDTPRRAKDGPTAFPRTSPDAARQPQDTPKQAQTHPRQPPKTLPLSHGGSIFDFGNYLHPLDASAKFARRVSPWQCQGETILANFVTLSNSVTLSNKL